METFFLKLKSLYLRRHTKCRKDRALNLGFHKKKTNEIKVSIIGLWGTMKRLPNNLISLLSIKV